MRTAPPDTAASLGQWPTPAWAAAALVREHLADLDAGSDFVLEPTCGPGRFLAAIPADVAALGVELDPQLAEQARQLTGRTVITGDFLDVAIQARPTVVLGNPPFQTTLIEKILDKAHRLLADDGRVIADRRPTQNPAWREQVRKVCQTHAQRVGRGRYASKPRAPRTTHENRNYDS